MNIALSCDEKYLPQTLSTLHSILKSNKGVFVDLYFLTFKDSNHALFVNKFSKTLGKKGKFHLLIVDNKLELVGKNVAWNRNVLNKLFLPLYLPSDVKTILYFDSDIIVKKSLKGFSDFQPKKETVVFGTREWWPDGYGERTKKGVYLNAGSFGFVVENYIKCFPTSLSILNSYQNIPFNATFNDQDFINYYFDDYKEFFDDDKFMRFTCDSLLRANKTLSKKPVVLHYAGSIKPWHYNYNGNYFLTYWWYAVKFYKFSFVVKLFVKRAIWKAKKIIKKIFSF